MTTQEQTLQSLAAEYLQYFETRTRNTTGKVFYAIADEAPKELKSSPDPRDSLAFMVHEDGRWLPDDYKYQYMHEALETIADCTYDDIEDALLEWEADIYSSSLMAWYESHLYRTGYVEDARHEGLIHPDDTIDQQLMIGQYAEWREVSGIVYEWLCEQLENREEW